MLPGAVHEGGAELVDSDGLFRIPVRRCGRSDAINSGGLATSPCALNSGHLHAQYRLYSQNIMTLISTIKILETFRLYSRNILTLFSKHFDFILETFRLYSQNILTLFSKHFDFILVTFRLYSRNISTLFS